MQVKIATSDEEIERCWPVVSELRPHLKQESFVARIKEQMQQGFHLTYVEDNSEVIAAAGYRFLLNLAWGKFLYVDDLITREKDRSTGAGKLLLQWLENEARKAGCERLELDSGVQRFHAHRFYLRERMIISSHHFSKQL